jgi:hypothetical protein
MTEFATTRWNAQRGNSTAVAGNPVVESRLALSGGISVIILPILVVILLVLVILAGAGGLRS